MGAGEIVQPVKVPAAGPDDLSLILSTHMIKRMKFQKLSAAFHVCAWHTHVHMHRHTYTLDKCNKIYCLPYTFNFYILILQRK